MKAFFRDGMDRPVELVILNDEGEKDVIKLTDREFMDLSASADTLRPSVWQRVRG